MNNIFQNVKNEFKFNHSVQFFAFLTHRQVYFNILKNVKTCNLSGFHARVAQNVQSHILQRFFAHTCAFLNQLIQKMHQRNYKYYKQKGIGHLAEFSKSKKNLINFFIKYRVFQWFFHCKINFTDKIFILEITTNYFSMFVF